MEFNLGTAAVLLVLTSSVLGGAYISDSIISDERGDEREPSKVLDSLPDNIVYISVDAVSAEHLPCYGYRRNTAPNICGLENAVVYRNAYTVAPWTLLSVHGMQTGKYPHRVNVISRQTPMNRSYTTIAEVLDSKGYRTVLESRGPFLSLGMNSDQGFDRFVAPLSGRGMDILPGRFGEKLNDSIYYRLHIIGSHDPYDPSKRYYNYSDYRYIETVNETLSVMPRRQTEKRGKKEFNISEEERRRIIDQYDENIRAVDRYVARFIKQLKERNQYRDSLIIITSDHGESFNSYGEGVWLHQNVVPSVARVPMIVKYPGADSGGTSSKLVSNLDPFRIILNEVNASVDYPVEAIDPRYASRKRFFSYKKGAGYGVTNGTHYAFHSVWKNSWSFFRVSHPRMEKIQGELESLKQAIREFRTEVRTTDYKRRLNMTTDREIKERLEELGYTE